VTTADRREPRLFFHCYDHQRPAGGQKHTYSQVDALNQRGFHAYVVHGREDFRLQWFANTTRILGPVEFARLYDPALDLLVLPEDLGAQLHRLPGRKVVFNKGVQSGFRALGLDAGSPSPYERADVIAVLAVSEHNARILRHAYPGTSVHVTRPGLDLDRFLFRRLHDKQRQIAWAPKNLSAVAALRQILAARARQGRNQLGDFRWLRIADLSEAQTSQALADSLIFVFLSTEEGFGLLPREAALCGCLTVAYDAGTLDGLSAAGRHAPGDVLAAVNRIEEIAATAPADLGRWQAEVDGARDQVACGSLDAAGDEAATAWSAILSTLPRGPLP
jgi:hypothetical protein